MQRRESQRGKSDFAMRWSTWSPQDCKYVAKVNTGAMYILDVMDSEIVQGSKGRTQRFSKTAEKNSQENHAGIFVFWPLSVLQMCLILCEMFI